jgi:hypothetical protein
MTSDIGRDKRLLLPQRSHVISTTLHNASPQQRDLQKPVRMKAAFYKAQY